MCREKAAGTAPARFIRIVDGLLLRLGTAIAIASGELPACGCERPQKEMRRDGDGE